MISLIADAGALAFCIYSSLYSNGRPDILMLLVATIFFGWIGMINLRLLRAVDDRVAVDGSGIWYLPFHGPNRLITWDKIGRIRSHNISRYLEVIDVEGTSKVKLEYTLNNFSSLRQLISERHIQQ